MFVKLCLLLCNLIAKILKEHACFNQCKLFRFLAQGVFLNVGKHQEDPLEGNSLFRKLFTCYFSFPYCKRNDHIKGFKSYTIHVTNRDIRFFCDLKQKRNITLCIALLNCLVILNSLDSYIQNEDAIQLQK